MGNFPACVLHLDFPAKLVDVNVHPAKTEVKFLNEKAVFDCVHYGVLGALNKTADRPQVQFKPQSPVPQVQPATTAAPQKQTNFFRTMSAQEYKNFTSVIQNAPKPDPKAAAVAVSAVERTVQTPLQEKVILPKIDVTPAAAPVIPAPVEPIMEQVAMPMPEQIPWRMVGELYQSYILVEQGEEAFLIDKHAAHERILFEKLKSNQEAISSQALLTPISCRLTPDAVAILLENRALLDELGFEVDEFGGNTLLLRQIPMDLSPEDGADALESLAADLLSGRREKKDNVRDELLHTVACKAAIKAGWRTSEKELLALVKQVMESEELKYCPHGRPICITLSKKQLEKQFKR